MVVGGGRSSLSGLKVTVFGATGFTGRYIVNKLGQIGSQVVIPYRGDEYDMMHLKPLADLGRLSAQYFSLKDTDSIVSAVKYSDVVINLIAQDRETRNFKFDEVHVEGPLRIAKACQETSGARFIHVSSALSSTDAASKISRSRAQGEAALRSEYPESIIVRPSVIFGHEDRFLRALGTFSSLPLGYPLVNHGKSVRNPLYVGDFADGLMRLTRLNADLVAGKTFDLFGPKQYTMAEVVKLFCYFACRPYNPINLPPLLMNLYARLNPEWRRFLFTRELIRQMSEDEVRVEGSLSWSDLGINVADLKTLERDALPFIRPFRQIGDFSRILPPLGEPKLAQIESQTKMK